MKKKDLNKIILEAYEEVLLESLLDEVEDEKPQPEEEGEKEGPVLEDSTDQISKSSSSQNNDTVSAAGLIGLIG